MDASISGYIRQHHLGLIAVFIAMTGTAWAGSQAGPQDIAKNAVRGKHVANGKLGTKDIADGTTKGGLTGADIVPGSLGTEDIDEGTLFNDDSLNASDIANDGSLGTAEIDEGTLFNDDSLTAADLGPDAVGASEIAGDGVGASEVATGAIGAPEVLNDSIGADEIADSGNVEAFFDGGLAAGDPASGANPNAFLSVSDDLFGVSRATGSGGSSVLTLNTAAGAEELTLGGDLDVDDSLLELDDVATPLTGSSNTARIYLAGTGAAGDSELRILFANGTNALIAQD